MLRSIIAKTGHGDEEIGSNNHAATAHRSRLDCSLVSLELFAWAKPLFQEMKKARQMSELYQFDNRNLSGLIHFGSIQVMNLVIQCQQVIDKSDSEKSTCQQEQSPGHELAKIESVDTKEPQEDQQRPADAIVVLAGCEFFIRLTLHRWDQKRIDNPTNPEQTKSQKPDDPSQDFTVIKSMGTRKSNQPKQVTNGNVMGGCSNWHLCTWRLVNRRLGLSLIVVIVYYV